MRFRERLMCVLAPVRNFSVVSFERVTLISVCRAVPVRSGLDHLCWCMVGCDAKVRPEAAVSILETGARWAAWAGARNSKIRATARAKAGNFSGLTPEGAAEVAAR